MIEYDELKDRWVFTISFKRELMDIMKGNYSMDSRETLIDVVIKTFTEELDEVIKKERK